jgi:hypothetical protein
MNSVTKDASENIIAVGGNTLYNGQFIGRLCRIFPNGTLDTSLNVGAGFNNSLLTVEVDSSGNILAGGYFTSYSGSAVNRIVRILPNGNIDSTFNIGSGFNGIVTQILPLPGNKVLCSGLFTTYQGITRNRIIRLNADGTVDETFNVGTGASHRASQMRVLPSGDYLINFNSNDVTGLMTYKGQEGRNVIIISPTGDIVTRIPFTYEAVTVTPSQKFVARLSPKSNNPYGIASGSLVQLNDIYEPESDRIFKFNSTTGRAEYNIKDLDLLQTYEVVNRDVAEKLIDSKVNVGALVTTSSFNAFTGSYSTGSFTGSFRGNLQGVASTASLAPSYALTSSFNSFTSSYNTGSFTGTLIGTSSFAISSSYSATSTNADTASYLNTLNQNLTLNGDLTINGTASINTLVYNTIQYSTGSNQLGEDVNDVQTLYGSVIIPTGSLTVTGSIEADSISIKGTNIQTLMIAYAVALG